MSGGQNTRINNEIKRINRQIQEFNLELLNLIKYLDEDGYVIDDGKIEKYDEVINSISEVIGQLTTFCDKAAPRTAKKKEEYIQTISDLKILRDELSDLRQKHR